MTAHVRHRVVAVALLGSLAAALTVPRPQVSAAAPNQLSSPTVSPTGGDTATIFMFGVHYTGAHPATTVTAIVGTRSVVLSLASGSATDGAFAGKSSLPVGTWTVTFTAVASKANAPTIAGGTITVAGPTPTPRPAVTPAPTPAPPATITTPAPKPATSTPAPKPAVVPAATPTTAGGTPAASGTAIPAAAAPPGETDREPIGGGLVTNPTPNEGDSVPAIFWPIMLGGFAAIALLIAFWLLAMRRDGRRRAVAAEEALAMRMSAAESLTASEPVQARAVWELDAALEEAPIGTVQYLPLEDGRAIGALPEGLPEPDRPRRGNPRQARIADARNSRQVEDRRSLLRRS